MHPSSMENMQICLEKYVSRIVADFPLSVVDIGGANIGGTFSDIFNHEHYRYIAVDIDPEAEVDIVLEDPYKLPFESASLDIVISGQVFEHVEFFWLLFEEMARVVKNDGLIILLVPSSGYIHRYPVDCYRFNPDAMDALAKYVGINVIEKWHDKKGPWKDVAAVFSPTLSINEKVPKYDRYHSNKLRDSDPFLNILDQYKPIPTANDSNVYDLVCKQIQPKNLLHFYYDDPLETIDDAQLKTRVHSYALSTKKDETPYIGSTAAVTEKLIEDESIVDFDIVIAPQQQSLRTFLNFVITLQPLLSNNSIIILPSIYKLDNDFHDIWKVIILLNQNMPETHKLIIDDGDSGFLVIKYTVALGQQITEEYNPFIKRYSRLKREDFAPLIKEKRFSLSVQNKYFEQKLVSFLES